MRWLITGATGFKGAWLAAYLATNGEEIVGLCGGIRRRNAILFDSLSRDIDAPSYEFDICDSDRLTSIIRSTQPDCIIHLAGQALVSESVADPIGTFSTNVIGTVSLLNAVKDCDHRIAVVCITSDKCYHNKEWPWPYREDDQLGGKDNYSASKACAELAAYSMTQSLNIVGSGAVVGTARAGNVIGGGDFSINRLIPDFIRHLDSDKPLYVRRPHATRPWQHVLDPISGYVRFAEALYRGDVGSGESLNFGPSQQACHDYSVKNVLHLLSSYFDNVDLKFESSELGQMESGLLALSTEKAKAVLGWSSVIEFEHAIDLTARFYGSFSTGVNTLQLMASQINEVASLNVSSDD